MADFDASDTDRPRGIGWLLSYQASRDPHHPALTFEGETLSRGELDARIRVIHPARMIR